LINLVAQITISRKNDFKNGNFANLINVNGFAWMNKRKE
jgi:hypothetical protein